jgi:hypothetical protein
VPPISHKIAHDAEQTDELDACIGHTVVGHVADELGRGAGRFDIGPDAVAIFAQRESAEGRTYGTLSENALV